MPFKGTRLIYSILILILRLQNVSYNEVGTFKLPSTHLLEYNEIIGNALKVSHATNSSLYLGN